VNNKPLAHDLGVAIGRTVLVSNDANCFALSEAVDGAARDARVVFGVILGTGVGGGIVIDKRVLDGVNGIAGEWGHNSLPWITRDELPGVRCYCGRHACIETFLCGAALRRTYLDVSGSERSVPEVAQLASEGDAKAERAMALYEDRLARALASVINLLDPEVIVLGGGLSNLDRLPTNVPKLWKSYVFSDSVRTRLVSAMHGDSGGVRGAAWLWE
jgi:predicted NBD/HSP70 family sugar kinase